MSVPLSEKQFQQKPNRALRRSTVRLDKIVATQIYLDRAKVKAIAQKDSSDISSDPIVHPLNGLYVLGDGHHRVGGAIERGDTHIPVRIAR